MNELTPAQERYMVFVKELVNEGLDRVERVLGVDSGSALVVKAVARPEVEPLIEAFKPQHEGLAPTPRALAAPKKPHKRYKKRSDAGRPRKKAVIAEEVSAKPVIAQALPTTRPCGCSAHGAHRKTCQHSNWPAPVSAPAPAQSDGVIRSGQRMPMSGVPVGFAECRCGRIRKSDEQFCVVCSAMRMKRPA